MLKTRLLLGSLMAAAAGGVLYVDQFCNPYYPILLLVALAVGFLATRELVALIPSENRPREWLCLLGVVALISMPFGIQILARGTFPPQETDGVFLFSLFVVFALLVEMFHFREPGKCITRVAHAVFVVGYLGLLPSLFLNIRWLPDHSGWMLALAIFVPKCCDIGAYGAGRIFGKHPLTPLLSPKKTWEGIAGGLVFSIGVAVVAGEFVQVFNNNVVVAALFGLTVGSAGIFGDLAESMIKRDALAKDASRTVPGFGGVLDVIDSILFAGPVAYAWFFIL